MKFFLCIAVTLSTVMPALADWSYENAGGFHVVQIATPTFAMKFECNVNSFYMRMDGVTRDETLKSISETLGEKNFPVHMIMETEPGLLLKYPVSLILTKAGFSATTSALGRPDLFFDILAAARKTIELRFEREDQVFFKEVLTARNSTRSIRIPANKCFPAGG